MVRSQCARFASRPDDKRRVELAQCCVYRLIQRQSVGNDIMRQDEPVASGFDVSRQPSVARYALAETRFRNHEHDVASPKFRQFVIESAIDPELLPARGRVIFETAPGKLAQQFAREEFLFNLQKFPANPLAFGIEIQEMRKR